LKKMSPTRSQLDVSKDGKNPNDSPNKTLRWALCLLSPVFCLAVVCGASGSSLPLPQAIMVRWCSGSAALIHPPRRFSCGAQGSLRYSQFYVLFWAVFVTKRNINWRNGIVIRLLVW
jgi:hypothetical protein